MENKKKVKVGDWVSIGEADSYVGMTIVLRRSTMDFSKPGGVGQVAYIGDDYYKVIDPSDAVIIRNTDERDIIG